MHSRFAWLFVVAATGCGSPAKPPAAKPNTATAANKTTAAQVAKPSMESQRGAFIEGCMDKVQGNEYCDCGFAQFAEIFKDADLSKEIPEDDPRMGQLAVQMKEACSDKFPEPKAKEQFLKGCAEKQSNKDTYCNCAWTELRKTLSVGDILTFQPGNTKFMDAKKGIPRACKGKYPAELALSDFLNACKKDGQKTEKQCQCLWKKVTKKFSIEELVVGTGDVSKVAGLNACK
jgi:hypothetical protein